MKANTEKSLYINPKTKIVIAMIIWGTLGIFVRSIKLDSIEIAFFRALIGSIFLLIISLFRKERFNKHALKKDLFLLSVSGLALSVNWVALFQAMKYTTISNAILSYYFAPVFIIIFSSILFKEKITSKNILCIVVSIIGLFMVLKSEDSDALNNYNHMKGILYGLGGAVIYGIIVMINKYVKELSSFQRTLVQLFIAALILVPITLGRGIGDIISMDLTAWIMILILGIIHTGIAYLLYFSSINQVESKSVAILGYLDPIFSIIFAFLILKESMTLLQLMGGILILSSAYISEK